MIILFEENEKEFTSLGLGVLKDVLTCSVTEKLNDSFELEMTYPVIGVNFNKLKINRIVYCKPNPYDSYQPFRIYSITKPLDGTVTVYAFHISYDTNGIPVKAVDAKNLVDLFNKIQNGEDEEVTKDGVTEKVHKNYSVLAHNFTFNTDIYVPRTFKTTAPFNLRALLMGGEESITDKYEGELKFDKFNVQLLKRRGKDRGAKVKYGHNMTDLSHESNDDLLYNGVFPYYHSEKTTTETETQDSFKKVYIVGNAPFQKNWLSYTEGGEPYIPLDDTPVQIATEGEYLDKVVTWSETYQKFIERIYNQQTTLIQGVLEPSWISIDWSQFPTIICKANAVGYFKTGSDSDWGELKGVGDVIFDSSIKDRYSGLMENIIIYFSEIVPSNRESENTEVSEIVDVQLDDPIIWIKDKSDTRGMLHDRILSLDLTSEFDEEPTQEKLKAKAEEYINKNKIGSVKHSTTVSFVDLAQTTEADRYSNFDHIELGDDVEVIYQDLDVDVRLRVISTKYDAIADRYESIDLGEKKDKMSSSSVQTGDNVSSLSNDAGYADVTTVNKLIAKQITAEYLEAVNAKLSEAQIKQLSVEKIECAGIIEASQFTLDTLVAKLLTADNAEIKETLKAGHIEVAGDIDVRKGQISITSEDGNTSFNVDREGNVTANSVAITGGTLDINDGMFLVESDGTMTAMNAKIVGHIEAETGKIGGFTILQEYLTSDESFDPDDLDPETHEPKWKDGQIYINPEFIMAGNNMFKVDSNGTVTIKSGEIKLGDDHTEQHNPLFYVDNEGNVQIKKGSIEIGDDGTQEHNPNFKVESDGTMTAKGVNIKGIFDGHATGQMDGTVNAEAGIIGSDEVGFTIEANALGFGSIGDPYSVFLCSGSDWHGEIAGSGDISGWAIVVGTSFGVNVDANGKGKLFCDNGKIGPLDVDSEKLSYTTDDEELWFSIDPSTDYDDSNPFNPKTSIYARSITFDKLLFPACIYLENPESSTGHNEYSYWVAIDKQEGRYGGYGRIYKHTVFNFKSAPMYGIGPDPTRVENVADIPLSFLSSIPMVVSNNLGGQPLLFEGLDGAYSEHSPKDHRFIKIVQGTRLCDGGHKWTSVSLPDCFSEQILCVVASYKGWNGSMQERSANAPQVWWDGTTLYLCNHFNENSHISYIAIGI